MLTIHHLADSRSQRIVWLMEELGVPYDLVRYERNAQTRFAPPDLKAAHPLGKAPAIVDGGVMIHESGAIVEHLIATRGAGRLRPEPGSQAALEYLQWMHFAEGSAMTPLLLNLYAARIGEGAAPILPRVREQVGLILGYIDSQLSGREYFVGDSLTGADVMMSFPLEFARSQDLLSGRAAANAWLARIHVRPAYRAALLRGGPYSFAA